MGLKSLLSDGKFIVVSTAIVGGVIIAVGAYKGAILNEKASKNELEGQIGVLEKQIILQGKEIADKNQEIGRKTNDILKMSKSIDTNTKTIERLSNEISKVAQSTNQITKNTKAELREKGTFTIKVPEADRYLLNIGGNAFSITKKTLESGYKPTLMGLGSLPMLFKKSSDNLFISINLRDREKNLIFALNENEWAVNRKFCFSVNYDENGIEIIDRKGLLVFQMSIKGQQFHVETVIYNDSNLAVVNNKGINLIRYDTEGYEQSLKDLVSATKLIFKHQGEAYLGQRMNDQN